MTKGSFRRSVSWQALSTVLGAASSFAYSLLLAKWLGADRFGELSVALAVCLVVFQVVEPRLSEAVVKYLVEYHEAQDEAGARQLLRYAFLLDAGSGVLAFALALAVAGVGSLVRSGWPAMEIMVLAAGFQLAWNTATNTAQGVMRALDDFKRLSIITVVQSVVKLAITAFAVWFLHWSTRGVLVLAIVVAAGANVATVLVALRTVRSSFSSAPKEKLVPPRERLGEMIRFVRNTYLANLTQLPLKDLDVALLGFLVPHATVGGYRIARNFFIAANLVFDPVYYTMYPEIARLIARRSQNELRVLLRKTTIILGSLAVVIAVSGAIVVPVFLDRFFAGKYEGAVPAFWAMLPGLLLWAPFVWVPGLLLSAGRSDLSLRAGIAGAVIVLGAYGVLIPAFGTIGAAIAVGPGGAVVTLISLYYARRSGLLARAPAVASS